MKQHSNFVAVSMDVLKERENFWLDLGTCDLPQLLRYAFHLGLLSVCGLSGELHDPRNNLECMAVHSHDTRCRERTGFCCNAMDLFQYVSRFEFADSGKHHKKMETAPWV